MKRVLKYLCWTVGISLIVLLLFLGSLFFRDQRLPRFIIERIENRLTTSEFLFRIDGATFGFRGGLRLQGVRVYDLRRQDSLENPVGKVRLMAFDYFQHTLDLDGAEYRRLPDSYYETDQPPKERQRVEFDLPDLPELRVRLTHPVILGVHPDFVTARVNIGNRRIAISDVHVTMPDRDRKLELDGSIDLDLNSQHLSAQAKGLVRHAHIPPVLDVLDVPHILPYVTAFTELTDAVDGEMTANADLFTGDLDLKFNLKAPPCRYNGVQVARAEGSILLQTYHVGTNENYRLTIDLPYAFDPEGRQMGGRLTLDNFAGPIRLGYNGKSDLRFEDLMSVIDVFEPETFSFLVCDTPPVVTLKGTSGVDGKDLAGFHLTGTVDLRHGSIGGFQVDNLASTFTLRRDVLEMENRATGKTGGQLAWHDKVWLEGFDEEKTHFSVKGTYTKGSLEELADIFTFDLGERNGRVDANFELSGLMGTNLFSSLNGKGSVNVTDGHLAQMKLFAGLTELLAERVPGVSFLVNQSQASADFVVKDGVFSSDNVYVEGGLISIKGTGTYDIAQDNLDFIVSAQLFKKESLFGKVVHPLTSPLTKLLLEFKVTGPLDNPTWRYVQILDRIF